MTDRAKRRKRKHYRRRSWSPYALSGRLLQDTKAQDSADDRLRDYEEASAVITNNRPHRMNQNEKEDKYWRWFHAWARE